MRSQAWGHRAFCALFVFLIASPVHGGYCPKLDENGRLGVVSYLKGVYHSSAYRLAELGKASVLEGVSRGRSVGDWRLIGSGEVSRNLDRNKATSRSEAINEEVARARSGIRGMGVGLSARKLFASGAELSIETHFNAQDQKNSSVGESAALVTQSSGGTVALTLTQPLLRGRGRLSAVEVGQRGSDRSEIVAALDFDQELQAQMLIFINRFLRASSAADNLKVMQSALESAERTQYETKRRVELGVMASIELDRSRLAVSSARIELERAHNDLRLITAELLGVTECDSLTISGFLEVPVTDDMVYGIPGVDLSALPVAKRAALELAAAEDSVSQALDARVPDLRIQLRLEDSRSLAASDMSGGRYKDENEAFVRYVGLSFSHSFLDPDRDASVRQTLLSREAAAESRARVDSDLRARQLQMNVRYRAAMQELQMAQSYLKEAEQDLERTEAQYRFGVGTMLEVNTARNALTAARTGYVAARTNLLAILAEYWQFADRLEAFVAMLRDGPGSN